MIHTMRCVLVLLFLVLPCLALTPAHDALQVKRWQGSSVQSYRAHEVRAICDRIQRNMARYKATEAKTGVPWYVTAGLHNMESGGSFYCHLHEGSSLKARTRDVPKGRPKTGTPPFTWEFSAVDALTFDSMGKKNWSKLGPALSACEGYNGWGMMKYHPTTATPYLWSGMIGSDGVGKPGKYVADGKYSSTARSSQIGIAAIWKELERRKIITTPLP